MTRRQERILDCVHFSCFDPWHAPETCTCDNYAAGVEDRRCRAFAPTRDEVKQGKDRCPFSGTYGFHTKESGVRQ